MTTKIQRALWAVAALTLAAMLWLASRSGGPTEDRYGRDLRHLQALDARLNDQVMRSRSGALESYDAIVATIAEIHRVQKSLEQAPSFVGEEGRAEMAARRRELSEALLAKERYVDDFKTHHAVLRNSLRFFPVAAKELGDRLSADPGEAEIGAHMGDLLREVLLLNVLPEKEMLPRARAALARVEASLRARSGDGDAVLRDEIEVLLKHARVILAHEPTADALLEQLLRVPVPARAEQLDAAYSRSYHAALASSNHRRLLVGLLAAALVAAVSAAVILRLRRSASALRAAAGELAEANAALRHERERERELSELKDRFVSMTSHEFRTPLSIILSSSEMLEAYADRWQAEKKRSHHQRIQSAVSRMTKMLDGILLIGRADAGALRCTPAPLDVPELCAELIESLEQSTGKTHTLELDVAGDWQGAAFDERLLGQILVNLLSNAIKYSPDGGLVRLAARAENDLAVFDVEDQGIGILPEDEPRLFQIFHRGKNARAISGTGLGLAIVKRAADLHGGTISFEARPGGGTRFTARLPLHREAGTGADAA